jgi:hypothetical protein
MSFRGNLSDGECRQDLNIFVLRRGINVYNSRAIPYFRYFVHEPTFVQIIAS